MVQIDLSQAELKEIFQGCRHRRKSLDKAFKQCMSEEVSPAAEKVSDQIKVIFSLEEKIKNTLSGF